MPTRLLKKTILLTGLALCLGAPASADTIYHWTTDEGTVAYTDDAKRVPARYKATAKRRVVQTLRGYARYTPADSAAQRGYAEQVYARLDRLRELNYRLDMAAAHNRALADSRQNAATISLNGPGHSRFHVGVPTGQQPVVVDSVRVRTPGRLATHHNTVVRRGDQTLVVVRGEHDQQSGPGEFVSERELLR